jgi:hypothetical protein
MKDFTVVVFGKKGCDKCAVLNRRLDRILEDPEWERFEKTYYDVTTVEGLVEFSKAEILNPQRIPSFLVMKNRPDGGYERIRETSFEEGFDEETGAYRVPLFIGMQTDYKNGGGIIRPADIKDVLRSAVAAPQPA